MRLERRSGQVGRMNAVEAAHMRIYGETKPYHQIAAEIYDDLPSCYAVADRIRERYGVEVAPKTASTWINRGQKARLATPEVPV